MNNTYDIPREKASQITKLLAASEKDMLLILTREGSDNAVSLLVGTRSVHLGAMIFRKNGNHTMFTSKSDEGNFRETGVFSEIHIYGEDLADTLKKALLQENPKTVAMNYSEGDHLCDGLTRGLYIWFKNLMGEDWIAEHVVSSEDVLKDLRGIKTEIEVQRIAKAVEITCDIYEEVFKKVRIGMSEIEIGSLFSEGMEKRGVVNGNDGGTAPPMVLIVRAGMSHRAPGDTETVPGDIVVMDASVRYQGYCSDIARSMYMLKPGETHAPEDVCQAFDTVISAIDASMKALKPGAAGWEVDFAGRKTIEAGGYPTIKHSVGHQVGKECHDGGTRLGPRKPGKFDVERKVQIGEIYAIEPTVLQDRDQPSFIVEENVLVTENGLRIFSRRQKELILIS
jgi:Xaa-Pro aminopeptidase